MKRKFILIPLLALLLAGCEVNTSSSDSSGDLSSNDNSENLSSNDTSTSHPTEGEGYYKVARGENFDNRALEESTGFTALNSLGNQKILVVPVVFSDAKSKATPANLQALNKIFFGTSDETGWESVASFYKKSSFGRLNLTGEVRDYYYTNYTMSQFSNLRISSSQSFGDPNNYWDQTHYLIKEIYNSYPANVLKNYDLDGDGHVDALWMVYMNEYDANDDDSPFWAYKFYWNQEPNTAKPTPNTYAWASFDFADEGYGYSVANGKYDAHTFIHETGHMFGLNDYYDYEGKTSPVGAIDMMDYNIIDHNAYSKYLLNWVEPYYITGDAEITLRPAESSGDFVLLKDDWNGNAYDNYLLLEYYTPTGLNEKDAVEGYGPTARSRLKGFTESGVRIWHVDSRLIRINYRSSSSNSYTYTWTDVIEEETALSYTALGPTNTSGYDSRLIDELYNQIHLLDAANRTGNKSWLNTLQVDADNQALFKENTLINTYDWGSYFTAAGKNVLKPSNFNDGTSVGYSVEIGAMNASGVTIKITKG